MLANPELLELPRPQLCQYKQLNWSLAFQGVGMRTHSSQVFLLGPLFLLVFLGPIVYGQVAPHPLITRPVDETQLVTLQGNTHPLAQPQFDMGTAPPDLPLNRMLLVLKRSPQQDFALKKLLDDQQDKNSPNYHKWLTPDEFGQQFGATDQDLQLITGWLQSHGLQISRVSRGRSIIEFSGMESQLENAFHAQIHQYLVNGQTHWANASDPQIPAALAPAVAGVWTLHNFYKKPQVVISQQQVSATAVPGRYPLFTSGSGTHALVPADFYKIYNISPQFGGGPSIAIVARSNINTQDVIYFHYWTYDQVPSPNVIVNGPDPGDLGGAEEVEAVLDTTWSGAVAPDAWVTLVVSGSTSTTDGVDLSETYIIDNNLADVMSESFGDCEANYTSTQALGIASLAQQAATEGITYVVASGDSGSAGCDNPNTQTTATHPPSVNVLASTPYNLAVGGTIFNENGQNNKYWSTTPNQTTLGSALSYIPENVWNQSCTSAQCGSKANILAGGGGVSTFYPKPPWQTAVPGDLSPQNRTPLSMIS
jgi:subtilase family serine protease